MVPKLQLSDIAGFTNEEPPRDLRDIYNRSVELLFWSRIKLLGEGTRQLLFLQILTREIY